MCCEIEDFVKTQLCEHDQYQHVLVAIVRLRLRAKRAIFLGAFLPVMMLISVKDRGVLGRARRRDVLALPRGTTVNCLQHRLPATPTGIRKMV